MKALFRYCGNKGRLLKFYRKPPPGTRRIVEPYLGSGAFSLNFDFPILGIDADPNVVELWNWLKTVSEEDLHMLGVLVERERTQNPKFDIRSLDIPRGAQLYLKVNICGLVVGQWSSWSIYPQHTLPTKKTLESLRKAQETEVLQGDASLYFEHQRPGDLVFLDPPYLNTRANYKRELEYDPKRTLVLLEGVSEPVIFTYGDGAPNIFPGLPWERLVERRVPNFRNGGTVNRTEYVCFLNWPRESDSISMFR